jgi:hypothetical protein
MIFDVSELSGGDFAHGELLVCPKQLRWPKQASNYIRVNGDHG